MMSFCLTSWPHVGVSWPSGHCTQTIKYPSVFQELPKYLRGYHNVTKEDMVNIAALLFRIKVGNDKSQFVMIPRMLKELVPADHLKTLSENEWRKVRRVWVHHKSSVICCVASGPDGATAPTLRRSCLWGCVMMPPPVTCNLSPVLCSSSISVPVPSCLCPSWNVWHSEVQRAAVYFLCPVCLENNHLQFFKQHSNSFMVRVVDYGQQLRSLAQINKNRLGF